MVNYCCVYGCGRNSRLNSHLNYYGLPKERHRQEEWLKAAGREDLLTKDQMRLTASHRFCSRHFTPSSIKNRHLCADAVPTLSLPGGYSDEGSSDEEPLPHTDVVCDNCQGLVVGRRYKCVSCADYDLCQRCEMLDAHPDHYVLRIPRPMKFKLADNLIKKWRRFFQAEHITPSCMDNSDANAITVDSESSDDEPITKYAGNYDSGVDLSEDVKEKIRKEVTRALKSKTPKKSKVKSNKNENKRAGEEIEKPNKKAKCEQDSTTSTVDIEVESAPEVVFADVNDFRSRSNEFKPTILNSLLTAPQNPKCVQPLFTAIPTTSQDAGAGAPGHQPSMQVKLSDDLSELMIEVTSNNQKTIYKY